jgi:hypothetical protein
LRKDHTLSVSLVGLGLLFGGFVFSAVPRPAIASHIEQKHVGGTIPWLEADLVAARDYQDRAAIRRHGWDVLASVTRLYDSSRPDGAAEWEMWHSRSETFRAEPGGCTTDSPLHGQDLPGAIASQRSGREPVRRILTVTVLYNDDACGHIRRLGLYQPASIESLLNKLAALDAPNYERDIPPFPRSSVVIKANWRRIPRGGGFIPVWLPGISSPQRVSVRVSSPREPCLLSTWDAAQPIPTSCFRGIPVTRGNHETFPQQTVDDGDVYVLVGLHIITKELPEWTWSTFWWSPRPNDGPFAEGRPGASVLHGVWRNYVMDTTLSMDTPSEPAAQAGQSDAADDCAPGTGQQFARACFNPYLEGRNLNEAKLSNCMNCHVHATYPPMSTDFRATVEQGYIDPNAPCFKGRIRLDYLWSLVPKTLASNHSDLTPAGSTGNATHPP